MRSLLPLTFLPAVLAQDNAFLQTVTQALKGAGLTSLADVATQVASTPAGQKVFTTLQNGTYTVFAPNNRAFSRVPNNVSSNATLLASILSYHILPGNFSNEPATSPNHTIGRTLLDDPELVDLEGGQRQVLALTRPPNGNITILNQGNGTNVTVLQSTNVANITLHVIPAVLLPPPDLDDLLDSPLASNISAIGDILDEVDAAGSLDFADVIQSSSGFTLFAPSNQALSAAQPILQQLQSNTTALQAVLLNHVINGTSAYSTAFNGSDVQFISAGGQTITAKTNGTGTFIKSGQSEVQVIQSDVLLENGVVHIVNGVLVNQDRNDAAASSAYESATSRAGEQATSTPTAPVGNPSEAPGGNNGALITKPAGALTAVLFGLVMLLA